MLPEPLHTGDYELYEVAAPYGYVLSSEPVPFTIDGSEAVVTVTQYNMPQKGQLTHHKDRRGVRFRPGKRRPVSAGI